MKRSLQAFACISAFIGAALCIFFMIRRSAPDYKYIDITEFDNLYDDYMAQHR